MTTAEAVAREQYELMLDNMAAPYDGRTVTPPARKLHL